VITYCGCVLVGAVVGVGVLVVAAIVVSEFCDANILT